MKLEFASLTLDLQQSRVFGPAGEIKLRPKSFEVLRYLAERAGQVVAKGAILEAVWPTVTVTDESLTRCISDIRQAIGDREQTFVKTIAKRGYLLNELAHSEAMPDHRPAPLPDLPSLAVLPFVNMSSDPEQEPFCEGMTEDIITELSRFSELTVIARNSSFRYQGRNVDVRDIGRELNVRYVLEGSIQRSGDKVRITGQLIDAETGAHLWADRFDRRLDDAFAVQDEIAKIIASVLSVRINVAEAKRPLSKPPSTWEAYDYFLRGQYLLHRLLTGTPVEQLYEARRLLERSIELDANFARPHAALSTSCVVAWINPVNDEYQSKDTLRRGFDLAQRAVELEPNLPFAHNVLANVLLYRRDREGCLAAWEKVFALNPNYCDWRYGNCLVLLGQPEQGLAAIRRHMRLDPFYPPQALMTEGLAHFVRKRYDEALPPFREMVQRAANFRNGRLLLAATYAHMGRQREAAAQTEALLRIEPDCSLRKLAGNRSFQSAEDGAHMFEGLRKAGIPE